MSSTLLEQARSLHEDLEVLEKAMYKELGDVSTATKRRADEIARDQVVATMLDSHTKRSRQLAQLYNDNDGARRDELTAMTGSGVFTAFYDQARAARASHARAFFFTRRAAPAPSVSRRARQLKAIREYHRKFPSQPSTESAETLLLSEVLESAPDEGFTGEEAEGRYMDLHAMHERYLNLKGVERVDYVAYLKQCGRLAETVPKESVSTASYARYAKELHRTFLEFVAKTQPLVPTTKMLEAGTPHPQLASHPHPPPPRSPDRCARRAAPHSRGCAAESDFAERWTRGEVTRYQSAPPANAPDATQPVVLSSYSRCVARLELELA
jgi:splicing factor 3A subunit 3